MSNAHADKFAARAQELLLAALWRQWQTLGITLSDDGRNAQTAVDPEALLFASAAMVDRAPRLRDALAAWLTERSGSLSIQRVRNLAEHFPATATGLLPTLARVAFERGKDHRWRPLLAATSLAAELGDRGKDLFASRTYVPSGAIMVQLRSGMGIGVKADVLAYLLCVSRHGQNWASIGSIVDALGYGKAAVGNATEEMCAAKFILAPGAVDPQARTPKMFRADPTAWASVLGLNDGSPSWTYWDQHYLFLTKYLAWHQEVTDRNVTDYALAVQLRALLEAHPRALTTDRAGAERAPEVVDQIPEFLERRMTTWQNWFRNLG